MQAERILVERINRRLDALGLSAAAASKKAGRSATFIRDLRDRPHASVRSSNLLALAEVLECSPAYLLGETDEPQAEAGTVAPPVGAPEAVPWAPPPHEQDNHPPADQAIRALCRSAESPMILRAVVPLPGFDISLGDLIIVDLERAARQGDLVAVESRLHDNRTDKTRIRRYLPPYLAPAAGTLTSGVELADGETHRVLGPVVGVLRVPGLTRD